MEKYTYINIPEEHIHTDNFNGEYATKVIREDILSRMSELERKHQPTLVDMACRVASDLFSELDQHLSNGRGVPPKNAQQAEHRYQNRLRKDNNLVKCKLHLKPPSVAAPLFRKFDKEYFSPLISLDSPSIQYLPYIMASYYWNTRDIHRPDQMPQCVLDLKNCQRKTDSSKSTLGKIFVKRFLMEDECRTFHGIKPNNISNNLRKTLSKNPNSYEIDMTLYRQSISCYYLVRRQTKIGLIPLLFELFDMSFVGETAVTLPPDIDSSHSSEVSLAEKDETTYFTEAIQQCLNMRIPKKIEAKFIPNETSEERKDRKEKELKEAKEAAKALVLETMLSYLNAIYEALLARESEYFNGGFDGSKYLQSEWAKMIELLKASTNLVSFANKHLRLDCLTSYSAALDRQKNHDGLAFSSKHLYLSMVYSVCVIACQCSDELCDKIDFEKSYLLFQHHTQAFHVSLCTYPLYTLDELVHAPQEFLSKNISDSPLLAELAHNRLDYIRILCMHAFNPIDKLHTKETPTDTYTAPSQNVSLLNEDPLRYIYSAVFNAYPNKGVPPYQKE